MELDFKKMNGLIPAIIQDDYTQKVLMLAHSRFRNMISLLFFNSIKCVIASSVLHLY